MMVLRSGGNYHICRYGMCHFLGAFFEQKINVGVSFLVKSQVVIHFGVCRFRKILFRELILIKFHLLG